jgi:hypothetical protein
LAARGLAATLLGLHTALREEENAEDAEDAED